MMKKIKFLVCIAAAGLILTSCNEAAKALPLDYDEVDQAIDTPWVDYSVPVTEVTFADGEDNITINKGETHNYNFTVSPRKANSHGLNWVSNNPDVATIDNGLLTAVGGGEARIVVTSTEEDLFDPIFLDVTVNVPLTGLDVAKQALDLDLDEGEGISFNYVPEDTTDLGVTFTSSNPTVAVVDEEGFVTSVGAGTATITINGKRNVSSTVAVTVSDKSTPIETLTITPAETNLEVEHNLLLDLAIAPEKANYEEIEWSSDNENIATVDENGLVEAIDAGTAHITARIEYRGRVKTATSTITVFENVADELVLDTYAFGLDTSGEKVRQINVSYKNGGDAVVPSRTDLQFTSSDESVAIVNSDGLVTALGKGNAVITVKDKKQDLEKTADVVVASSATNITITPSSYNIQPGDNVTIKATVAPSNADINVVDWTFSDATLYKNLVIDGNSIKFTAADKEGNLTVTAKIGSINANATIQIADAATGFGIIMNDNNKYQAEYRGTNEEGYEEYYLPNINFAQGSVFSLYNFETKDRWAVDLNPYSFEDTSGTGTFSKTYLSINEAGSGEATYKKSYSVLKAFKADLYIQLMYGSDRLYIGLVNGNTPTEDGVYTARIGSNMFALVRGEGGDVEGKVATYSIGGLIVKAGDALDFFADDERITSKFGPSGDDLDNLKYNNYIGSLESGLKVQADATGVSLYVDVWADGGASFWLEGGNSSDHVDESAPVVVDAVYGIKHNGNPIAGTSLGISQYGYDEYLVKGVSFAADDTFALYDYATGSSWAVEVNPYSFDDDEGTGLKWKEYLDINKAQDESYNVSYTVKKAFTGDLYIQIMFEADRLYIGLVPEQEQDIEVDANYKVAVGSNELSMIKQNVQLSDEEVAAGKVAVYATDAIASVTKGASVTFFMNGERIVSRIGASADGAESFNNYVGNIADGLKIQADAENVKIYLDIYQDGGASFWIEGGVSDDHVDGNVPVVSEGYYVVGSINGWAAMDEYKLAADGEDANHFLLANIELHEGAVLKVNDGVSAWFSNGHTYDGCGFTLDEDGNIKVAADGIYTINFYVTSGDDNHITLVKTADLPIDTSESVFYLKGTINDWIEKAEFELTEVASGHFQIKGMNFAAGDELKIYDAGTETWYGNAGTWDGCGFTLSEGGNLIVSEAGTYRVDFYVKADNHNHITLTKEAFVPESAVVEVVMGDAVAAEMARKDPDDANCVAKYVLKFDTLTADDEFKFLLDGKVIAVTPNADDTEAETPAYNNYIGSAKDGYKVKVSGTDKTMELRFWADSGISFWLPGGDSADHTDPSVISEGYGLIFGNGEKVLAVATGDQDAEGRTQYKISNCLFEKDVTFKLYNFATKDGWVVNIDGASFGGSDEYVVKGDTEYTVLQNFAADVYIKVKQDNDQIYFGLRELALSANSVEVQAGHNNSTILVSNWAGEGLVATSANSAIATVALGDEENGKRPVVITGVAAGSTTITVSDGLNSAKITVTVTSDVVQHTVTFSINYGTNVGDHIYMVGDFSEWGLEGAYKLTWNDGNNWTIAITLDEGSSFEFKFVVAPTDNPTSITRYEGGNNRTVTFDSTKTVTCNWQE